MHHAVGHCKIEITSLYYAHYML